MANPCRRPLIHPSTLLRLGPVSVSLRSYRIPVNEVKKGQAVSHKGKGRQGSHYKVELREAVKGGKLTERFNANAVLEGVDLVDKPFQFLYVDGNEIHLLDRETLEEHTLPLDALEASAHVIPLLNDEMKIKVSFHGDKAMSVKLPLTGNYTVVYTDPPASSVSNEGKGTMFKNAVLENDFTLTVPEFVMTGDVIVVELAEGKYKERVLKDKKR
ncbi:hypothetical protein HDU67_001554 [Dinochytrium kinnereticum]|nr:hypothetical protein HDU67_001554 [Dinochytrium kinnereticum]